MKVSSIGTTYQSNYVNRNLKKETSMTKSQPVQNVNFEGFSGKIVGGVLGMGLAGLVAVASIATPVGWMAAATLIASEAGGAVIGGAVGDKVSGEDEE